MVYTFSASVLEIYNENIYDLLAGNSSPGRDDDKLDVKQGPEGMYVPGLKVEEVRGGSLGGDGDGQGCRRGLGGGHVGMLGKPQAVACVRSALRP
jgi:hypothetical protein